MFNGIVEAVGVVQDIQSEHDCKHFTFSSAKQFNDLNVDDSISVNGVCLTVTHINENQFQATAVPETLRITNLKNLSKGSHVNLERSMQLHTRISGHSMQGHVDNVGQIIDIKPEGDALLVKISMPLELSKYIVNKGYITLDGMSITVIHTEEDWFTVTLIPHTQKITIANQYKIGTLVNIEVDILGKYIEKMLENIRSKAQ